MVEGHPSDMIMNRTVIKSLEEFAIWASTFNWEAFSLDTETTDIAYDKLEIVGFSLCDGKEACYVDLWNCDHSEHILEHLLVLLSNCKVLIAHNAVFDLKVLSKYGAVLNHVDLFCTMVADHLLDEERRHGLKHLAKELLGHDTTKFVDVVTDTYDSKDFYEYAINDAVWTWELAQYQKRLLEQNKDLLRLFRKIEMPFQWCLLEMQLVGVTVDTETAEKYHMQLQNLELSLLEELHAHLGEPYIVQYDLNGGMSIKSDINFGSPKQMGEILFDRLGLEVVEFTDTGKRSTGRKTLERYKGDNPFVETLYKYKACQKLISSFFKPLPDFIQEDGVIRPSFKDTGTKTGRLSSSSQTFNSSPMLRVVYQIFVNVLLHLTGTR